MPSGVFAREYDAALNADVDSDGDVARCMIDDAGGETPSPLASESAELSQNTGVGI